MLKIGKSNVQFELKKQNKTKESKRKEKNYKRFWFNLYISIWNLCFVTLFLKGAEYSIK